MAAAEERSPGDQEEEEEEVVSATAEACATGGGGDGRAGCVWGRESGCGQGHGGLTGAAPTSCPGTRGAGERPASAVFATRWSEWGQ